jgi:cbb3-type cytochrome oxidase subunit 3
LSVVGILAFNKSIDSSTTLSLFGLSLGYTTYVVGKRLKKEDNEEKE